MVTVALPISQATVQLLTSYGPTHVLSLLMQAWESAEEGPPEKISWGDGK
jgi:hypothetical protein